MKRKEQMGFYKDFFNNWRFSQGLTRSQALTYTKSIYSLTKTTQQYHFYQVFSKRFHRFG
jgi:hypothetical protein